MGRANLVDDTEMSHEDGEVVDNVEQDEQVASEQAGEQEAQASEPSELERMAEENKLLKQKLGNQGNEIGQMRKQMDELIQLELSKAKQAPQEPVDIWSDPDSYVEQKLANHPKLKQLDQLTETQYKSASMARLKEAHPDYVSIMQDSGFQEWVGKRQTRQALLQRADQQYDFDAADELFSTWKELREAVGVKKQESSNSRPSEVRRASTGTATAASAAPGRRKIYRRADLIKLRKENPDRYEALSDEIMAAYAEGRVR